MGIYTLTRSQTRILKEIFFSRDPKELPMTSAMPSSRHPETKKRQRELGSCRYSGIASTASEAFQDGRRRRDRVAGRGRAGLPPYRTVGQCRPSAAVRGEILTVLASILTVNRDRKLIPSRPSMPAPYPPAWTTTGTSLAKSERS